MSSRQALCGDGPHGPSSEAKPSAALVGDFLIVDFGLLINNKSAD